MTQPCDAIHMTVWPLFKNGLGPLKTKSPPYIPPPFPTPLIPPPDFVLRGPNPLLKEAKLPCVWHHMVSSRSTNRPNIITLYSRILRDAKQLLMLQPSLVEIDLGKDDVVNICGDIHGQFFDLARIFHLYGMPSERNQVIKTNLSNLYEHSSFAWMQELERIIKTTMIQHVLFFFSSCSTAISWIAVHGLVKCSSCCCLSNYFILITFTWPEVIMRQKRWTGSTGSGRRWWTSTTPGCSRRRRRCSTGCRWRIWSTTKFWRCMAGWVVRMGSPWMTSGASRGGVSPAGRG